MADKSFIVLLDMDSTVYDLLTPTLEYVNRRHNKNLTPQDITEWRWDKKYDVRPYDFWNKQGTYKNIKPFPGAVEAIKTVHNMGIRQVFLSAANFKYGTEKFNAVDRDFPFISSKDTILTGGNKDIINGDILVDDGPHNIEAFAMTGRRTILANLHFAPYCQSSKTTAIMHDWRYYPELIEIMVLGGWEENVG